MKWQAAPAFEADLRRLSRDELERFRRFVRESFVPAAERRAGDRDAPWPKSLRVKAVRGAAGVWECTWSYAGPDGRATFDWVTIGAEPAIRWRRVGGHRIFHEP